MSRQTGMALGLMAGIVIGLFLVALLFKLKVMDKAFDERQERARGQAYKYGFFTLAVSIWLFSQLAEVLPWIGVEAGGFLCLSFGGAVFSMTAVWKDAYLKLHERPERTMAALALGGIGCLCLSAFYVRREGVLVDGTLSLWMVVAVVSVQLLLILAVFLCRYFRVRREEDEA